jgi:hypothetical protein
MLQVLKSLSKTSSKDLVKHLRQAAAVFVDEDASEWLHTPLVPRVLEILHCLPAGRQPTEAVILCAAAVAVLNNLFTGLYTSELTNQFRQLLKVDQAACAALVHWGMARPEASGKLPSGKRWWRCDSSSVPEDVINTPEHPFWTPFTTCCSFLAAVETRTATCSSDSLTTTPYRPHLVEFDVQEAASPAVVERLLQVAIQHPCGALDSRRVLLLLWLTACGAGQLIAVLPLSYIPGGSSPQQAEQQRPLTLHRAHTQQRWPLPSWQVPLSGIRGRYEHTQHGTHGVCACASHSILCVASIRFAMFLPGMVGRQLARKLGLGESQPPLPCFVTGAQTGHHQRKSRFRWPACCCSVQVSYCECSAEHRACY